MDILMNTKYGAVEANFSEIQKYLEEQLQLYKVMIFTEETKKEAKETVAQLRKEKTAFQQRIKEVKADYMKPFEAFMTEANKIAELYDEPIGFISEQIEAFEKQRVEEKRKQIDALYAELVPEEEWTAVIPLARIFNTKWLNVTFKEKDIREEIMTQKLKAKEAISTIKSLETEKEEEAIALYKQNLDLTMCIKFITDYEKQKREIMAREAERFQREAEERIRAEERAKIEIEQRHQMEIEIVKNEAVSALIPDEDGTEAVNEYSYIINMTEKAKEKLELYMNSIGITYEEMRF